jgi:hypothetical protein
MRGESGPITWEIRDVRQRLEQNGSRMRWDYTILLHNRGATPVIFDRMDLGLQPAGNQQNVYGGIDSRSFVRHIDPNGELRVPRNDSWECPRCGASQLPQFFSQGIIRWITFTGQDMQSVPVTVEVRTGSTAAWAHVSRGAQ